MFDTLRKVMFFGLGAAVMSGDKVHQFIDELVERGDETADEGKKLYDDFTSRIEEEGRSANDRIRAQVQSVMRDMGMADKTQIAMLEARVTALENRIEILGGSQEAYETVSDIESGV